jgi:hypothetical protein
MPFPSITRRQLAGLFAGLSGRAIGRQASQLGESDSASGVSTLPHPRASAEIAAGIEPKNHEYPVGNVLRYGAIGDGASDDSGAISNAFLVAKFGSTTAVSFPADYTFKVTRYIEIYSNTTVDLYGTLQPTNRSAGLFCNGASNVSIYGHKVGTITDPSVAKQYTWNAGDTVSPSIHLRSCTNGIIDGVNFAHLSQGILASNATVNSSSAASWILTQTAPSNIAIRNCNVTFCEHSGIASYCGTYVTYEANHVFRCGDGGMWMMGCIDSKVINNTRLSPYADPAQVATHGANNPSHPNTWNDEQGLEFEACYNLTVRGNVVKGFWSQAIDIKNSCNWVDCIDNRVCDCENCSIVVRAGDAVRNSVGKVNIADNKIINHGHQHYNINAGNQAPIAVSASYIADIVDNVIWGWQNIGNTQPVGIRCSGPAPYMSAAYAANPHQASINVSRNKIRFGADAAEAFFSFSFSKATLHAILIEGQYDAVTCDGNQITVDAYGPTDRVSTAAAIALTYVAANGSYYPMTASISANKISGWGYHGITVNGVSDISSSGLSICNNSIGQVKGNGIHVAATNRAVINNNVINQVGSGSGFAAISLNGSKEAPIDGVVCSGNSLTGRFSGGESKMTHGIQTTCASNISAQNNTIAAATTSLIVANKMSGDHNFAGTSGFWRTGPSLPNGSVTAFWQGEMYFDTSTSKWWVASAYNSTRWTQLGP